MTGHFSQKVHPTDLGAFATAKEIAKLLSGL